MSKDNLVWLTSNCVILYNQGGFRKLLKKLSCYGDKARYKYSTIQHTNDSNAFEEIESDFVIKDGVIFKGRKEGKK